MRLCDAWDPRATQLFNACCTHETSFDRWLITLQEIRVVMNAEDSTFGRRSHVSGLTGLTQD